MHHEPVPGAIAGAVVGAIVRVIAGVILGVTLQSCSLDRLLTRVP